MAHDDDGLLTAAGRLFREKGFAATSLREIAAEAGMLPGSVHYRFPTKEDILVALMERGLERACDEVRQAVSRHEDPVARIIEAMRTHVELLVSGDPDVFALLYEMRSLSPDSHRRIVSLRDTYDALWDGLLYGAVGSGALRGDLDTRMARLLVLGGLNWTAQWYRPDGDMDVGDVAEAFWTLLGDGFTPRGST